MNAYHLEQLKPLTECFPELTTAQFETVALYAMGLNKTEIAYVRGVTYHIVVKVLYEVKIAWGIASLQTIFSVFRIRLNIYLMCAFIKPPFLGGTV